MYLIPKYFFTPKIVLYLQKIEAYRLLMNYIVSENSSKSNSTRFTISFRDSSFDVPITDKSLFINYMRAHHWIENNYSPPKRVIIGDIFHLHKLLLEGNSGKGRTGKYRDTYDIYPTHLSLVYLPEPSEIENQMEELLIYINDTLEIFPIVKASLVLLFFLKISPFQYGNLYIAQLFFLLVLQKENYQIKNTFSFYKYLDTEIFFKFLGKKLDSDLIVAYLEYILEEIYEAIKSAKEQLIQDIRFPQKEKLIPRHEMILGIIKEKNTATLKQLLTYFPDITSRTLSYHLKNLVKLGFIIKRGNTRGSAYTL